MTMLKETTGNMYDFITHTWNPIVGRCPHDCKYCYAIYKYGQNLSDKIKLKEECFKDRFGTGNYIFVGSGIDIFAKDIPDEWISRILDFCYNNSTDLFGTTNRFLFQSKNPSRILQYIDHPVFQSSVVCTTIETNRYYPAIMNNSPAVEERTKAMSIIAASGISTYLTIEPIMDFDLKELLLLIDMCRPIQINIGANTFLNKRLPEPSPNQLQQLIKALSPNYKIEIKSNLTRLLTT